MCPVKSGVSAMSQKPAYFCGSESITRLVRSVRSAAATYASLGLRVNAVAPGLTDTPMTAGMLKVDALREAAARQYPLGGIQTADQVAEVMCWLLSDAAQRVSGQVIPVDGGFCAVRPLVR